MNRRDPTRIELRLGDIQEYEQMKHELKQEGVSKIFSIRNTLIRNNFFLLKLNFFERATKIWRRLPQGLDFRGHSIITWTR